MSDAPFSFSLKRFRSSPLGIIGLCAILSLSGLAIFYPQALIPFFLDSLIAILLLAPAMLAGIGVMRVCRQDAVPVRWCVIGGASLGCGALSLITLLFGMLGWLNRPVFIVLNVVLLAIGLAALRRRIALRSATNRDDGPGSRKVDSFAWLWLLVVPFVVMSAGAVSTAPGFLWEEEGFAYDVLEYHLQVPKEYRANGRIDYLPHNVYASFPSNVEMLYLHAMILLDADVETGSIAHATHWWLGVLFVGAGWCVARDWSARAGTLVGVLLATTGWLGYLSGLAYVEHGVLLYGMLATGAILRALKGDRSELSGALSGASRTDSTQATANNSGTWVMLSGVFAGLSCGCKYTAVACLAVPLLVVLLIVTKGSWKRRIGHAGMYGLLLLLTFGPWLTRNVIQTGNPVFPLMPSVFNASPEGWGVEEAARWERGHRPTESESSVAARFRQLWSRVAWDRYHRFGPVLFVLAIAGLAFRKWGRTETGLVLLVLMQLVVWLAATHLYARFAVVFLIPLTLLAGRFIVDQGHAIRVWLMSAALTIAATWNGFHVARLHGQEHVPALAGLPASVFYEGQVPGFEYFGAVNSLVPDVGRVLLVGEARAFYFTCPVDYTVVFNHSPFLEVVRGRQTPDEAVQWLRSRSYTHVLVHWGEIERLRNTYGFAEQMTTALLSVFEGAGLVPVERFSHPKKSTRYVELYEIIGS